MSNLRTPTVYRSSPITILETEIPHRRQRTVVGDPVEIPIDAQSTHPVDASDQYKFDRCIRAIQFVVVPPDAVKVVDAPD